MLFDSHCHLNFESFDKTWRDVIDECRAADTQVVIVGAQYATSQKAVDIAMQYDRGVYAAVGLHPIHVLGSDFHPEEFNSDEYEKFITGSNRVVAVGETGIDFYHSDSNFEKQKEVFIKQIELAKKHSLPLIVHSRNSRDNTKNAYAAILEILKQAEYSRGVIHCFGGTLEEANAFINHGFYIGFTGTVTFKQSKELQNVAAHLPLDRILIETDSPYLAPEPHRGKENKPPYVRHVAEKIAEIRHIEYTEVTRQTSINAINLFGLN